MADERAKEWECLESQLERVVDEMMARDMKQHPFSQGKLIPRDDYIQLYEKIYHLLNYSRHGSGELYGGKLYNKYRHLLQKHIQLVFYTQENPSEKKGRKIMQMGKGEEGLEAFLETFKTFKQKMLVFSHILAYMHRYYIPKNDLPTLDEVLKTELHEQVLRKGGAQQLKIELANLMDNKRNGKSVNESLFGEVVALFLDMPPKTEKERNVGPLDDLEAFLLQRTRAYYTKTAVQWPQESLEKKVEQALKYERDFVEKLLPERRVSKFEEGLVEIMKEIVIAKGADEVDDMKLGGNLENIAKASLPCSTHLKLQDSSKSSIVDAFQMANV